MTRVPMTKKNFHDRCDEAQLGNPKVQGHIDETIQELKKILRADKDLMAITSAHLGIHDMRIICIKFANGDIRTFINPLIFGRKGMHLSRERQIGSKSKTEYIVPRSDEVAVAYQTPVGKEEANSFMDVVSEVFQQMNEVLDGTLLSDYGLEIISGFDEADAETKQEIVRLYLASLDEQSKGIEEEIKNNAELNRMNKAIDFMTKISTGEIETIELTEEEKEQIRKANEVETK